MRDFIFRGKGKDDGGWLEGSLMVWSGGCRHICSEQPDGKMSKAPVDPATVGQFTGLLDNNGTRIFEGDILHFPGQYADKQQVVFDKGGFCVGEFYQERFDVLWSLRVAAERTEYNKGEDGCEIIGNIHDNPELLEAQQ